MFIETRYRKFNMALSRIATSEDGKIVLKYLHEEFVEPTALSSDNNVLKTGVKIGYKELAQLLIKASKIKDEELDLISLNTTQGE